MKKVTLFSIVFILSVFSSAQQVKIVNDLCVGSSSSSPTELLVFNNKLYFIGTDGISFYALWEFDGINKPTKLFSNGFDGYNTNELCIYKNQLFFSKGKELWSYDGTNAPAKSADITQGKGASHFVVFHDTLFFNSLHETYGNELFMYDGVNNAHIFYDIVSGITYSSPSNYTVYNDALYFCPISGKEDLWYYKNQHIYKVDGTDRTCPNNLYVYKNELFYTAYNCKGNELWKYNSTTGSVVNYDLFPDSTEYYSPLDLRYYYIQNNSDPSDFCVFKDTLYFTAIDSTTNERKLWFYTETDGPMISQNISKNKFSFGNLTVFDNCLFFKCDDGLHGEELWRYNGNDCKIVEDINSGINGSQPTNLTPSNNKLFFTAYSPNYGRELWVYDPTINSLNQNNFEYTISVYPNPTNEKITIETIMDIDDISLFDLYGKMLMNTKDTNINLSLLTNGLYILSIKNKQGQTIERKIIKSTR